MVGSPGLRRGGGFRRLFACCTAPETSQDAPPETRGGASGGGALGEPAADGLAGSWKNRAAALDVDDVFFDARERFSFDAAAHSAPKTSPSSCSAVPHLALDTPTWTQAAFPGVVGELRSRRERFAEEMAWASESGAGKASGGADDDDGKRSLLAQARVIVGKLKIGQDLTAFELPASFLTPFSTVQAMAEDQLMAFEGCERDWAALGSADARERFKGVVKLCLDLTSARSTERPANAPPAHFVLSGLTKPINAVVGETHLLRCGDTVVTSEQLSHHPPTSATHVRTRKGGVELQLAVLTTPLPKWRGLSKGVHVALDATFHITLVSEAGEERYRCEVPDLYMRVASVRGPYTETCGRYAVERDGDGGGGGLRAELDFVSRSRAGGRKNRLEAVLWDGSSELVRASGRWDQELRDQATGAVWWSVASRLRGELPTMQVWLPDPAAALTESCAVWGPLETAIWEKDYRRANREKRAVERAQRRLHKELKRRGAAWEPRLFERVVGPGEAPRLREAPLELDDAWRTTLGAVM